MHVGGARSLSWRPSWPLERIPIYLPSLRSPPFNGVQSTPLPFLLSCFPSPSHHSPCRAIREGKTNIAHFLIQNGAKTDKSLFALPPQPVLEVVERPVDDVADDVADDEDFEDDDCSDDIDSEVIFYPYKNISLFLFLLLYCFPPFFHF